MRETATSATPEEAGHAGGGCRPCAAAPGLTLAVICIVGLALFGVPHWTQGDESGDALLAPPAPAPQAGDIVSVELRLERLGSPATSPPRVSELYPGYSDPPGAPR